MLLGTLVSIAQIPAGYYDAAQGKSGDDLKLALYNIIKGHTEYPYSSSGTDTWDILKETDRDPNNANNVIGLYSAFSMDGPAEYDGGNGWTREHVWAKSRGDFGTSAGAGTDVHHLRAEDASTNSARSNRNFDEATTQYIDGSGQYSGPTDSYTGGSGAFTWEPRAAVKGDVARMLFYMATRYEGEGGEPDLELTEALLSSTDKSPLHAKLSVLITWHNADPVDAMEQSRNDIIYGYQGNRNPFIDHPEYVDLIWGGGTPAGPSFTSTPVTDATEGSSYSYSITSTGGSGALTITATTSPAWLTLTDNGVGTGTLSGTPSSADVGTHSVALQVTDGTDNGTQSFSVTVSPIGGGGSASELLFSEYVEGSSYNKALEVANFTGTDVSLSAYSIKKQTNGSGSWSSGLALSGTLIDGDVYVLAHSSASASIQGEADFSGGNSELNFNGNDAIGLFKNDVLIDAIGVFGSTATYGANVTMVRNADITDPNVNYTTSEWTNYASDDFTHLGSHTMNVTPPNQAPSVSISAPSNGATVTTGSLVTITATASDTDGTVTSVEFFVNGASIGVDNTSPFEVSHTATTGSMNISATATDDDSATTTSATISITGEDPPPAGVLYFSEYIEGSSNNKALEIANTSGSTESLSGYIVKKETNGGGTWSTGISLSGTLASGEVYVLANSSANADIVSKADYTGGNSELTFNGNDVVGLFKDGTLIDIIGTFGSSATFAQNVTLRRNDNINLPNDTYTTSEWTTFATDNSAGLSLRIGEEAPNEAPSVSISSPTTGASFTDGETVTISVTASDSDGSVSTVEFFVDGVSIGSDSSSPYSVSWTIGEGTFSLTAVATDDETAQTTSTSVSVTGEAPLGVSETLISYDDFESGWGSFVDGGKDAYRSTNADRAYAGVGSLGIQNNTNSSVITYGSSVDITGYDQVRVDFFFLPVSMENGEDFWLQIYDGSSYVTVASWARGTDFSNNNFYSSSVTIDPGVVNFASNMRVRFRCDASGNGDDVYIDEVTVTGISTSGARTTGASVTITKLHAASIEEEIDNPREFEVFPNPFSDQIMVSLESEQETSAIITLYDLNGKVQLERLNGISKGTNLIEVNTTELKSGLYLLEINSGDVKIVKRLIKN